MVGFLVKSFVGFSELVWEYSVDKCLFLAVK